MSARHVLRQFWYPLAIVLVIALGLYMRREALAVGFFADDYAQIEMLQGHYPVARKAYDLFNFSDGSRAETDRLRRAGFYPWWAEPEVRLVMLRPLASLMIWLDHALFGADPFPYHVHSALWWIAMLALIALLLWRSLEPVHAAFAFLLLACSSAHSVPLWWICNRSVFVSTTWAVAALLAYTRFRVRAARPWLWVAVLCYAIAFGFGEYAFCALGYFAAYEVFEGRGTARERVLALVPILVPAVFFMLTRVALGATARHSGMYVDPLTDPLGFAAALVTRLPVLVGDLMFVLRADYWTFGAPWVRDWVSSRWVDGHWLRDPTPWRAIQVACGIVACAVAWLMLRFGLTRATRRRSAWLIAGSFASIVPVVASFPSTRLVLVALIGFSTLLAGFVLDALRGMQQRPLRMCALVHAALGCVVLAYHVVAPLVDQRREFVNIVEASARVRGAILHMDVDDALAGRELVLLAAPEGTTSMYVPPTRRMYGRSVPHRCMYLSHVPAAYVLTRESSKAFSITFSGDTAMLRTAVEQLLRPAERPLHVKESVDVGLFRATVLELVDGLPKRVRFAFDRSLDDSSLVFMVSEARGFRRFELPPVGESRGVAPPAVPQLWNVP